MNFALTEYMNSVLIYLGAGLLVLFFWTSITLRFSRPLSGILWIIMFSILFAPTLTNGEDPKIAPAVVGIVFAVIGKDPVMLMNHSLSIVLMIAMLLLVGFVYEQLRRILR